MQGIMHKINRGTLLRWSWIALVTGLCLWPMSAVMADEQWGRLGYLIVTPLLTLFCFARSRRHWQLLYPALLAVTWSILLPIACTLLLACSNFSGSHLISQSDVYHYLLQTQRIVAGSYDYKLFKQPDGHYFLQLSDPQDSQWHYYSPPIALLDSQQFARSHLRNSPIHLVLKPGMAPYIGTEAGIKEIVRHKKHLVEIRFTFPASQGNPALDYRLSGLRKIAGYTHSYRPASSDPNNDTLMETKTADQDLAVRYAPNRKSGYYQPIDKQGHFYGAPLEPGFVTFSPANLWQNIKQLNRPFDTDDNTYLPRFFGSRLPAWLMALPWLHTLFWSLGYGLVCLTISSALATLNAFCLQGQRKSLSWLRLLVLPAAIPLTFQALIYKGLFYPRLGELYTLLSQLIGKGVGDNPALDYSIFNPLLLLLSTTLALLPLLTLWFSRLATDLSAMPLLTFTKQLLLRSKPTLLLLLGVLMLAQPLYMLTNGYPSHFVAHKLYQMGITDTLGSMSYPIAFLGGSGEHYELACTLLLFILPMALLLGWWRYKALQQQAPLPQSLMAEPTPPKLTGHLLPRLWLGAMALMLWLPLLLLMFVSLRQGQCFYLKEGESAWSLFSVEFTLDHFRSAFNMTVRDVDGMLIPPPFPFIQWLGNSLSYAGSLTLLTLAIALPAAWALARYQFAARQTLYRLGIVLQALMPALLTVAIYHLLYNLDSPFHLMGTHIVVNLGIVLLAIFPLTAALQPLGESETWRQALARRKPILLILGVLLFLQQIGERALSNIMFSDYKKLAVAAGMEQYLYPGNYIWGDFAAAMVVLAVPLMALFYWLVPKIDRNLINHWRPM